MFPSLLQNQDVKKLVSEFDEEWKEIPLVVSTAPLPPIPPPCEDFEAFLKRRRGRFMSERICPKKNDDQIIDAFVDELKMRLEKRRRRPPRRSDSFSYEDQDDELPNEVPDMVNMKKMIKERRRNLSRLKEQSYSENRIFLESLDKKLKEKIGENENVEEKICRFETLIEICSKN